MKGSTTSDVYSLNGSKVKFFGVPLASQSDDVVVNLHAGTCTRGVETSTYSEMY